MSAAESKVSSRDELELIASDWIGRRFCGLKPGEQRELQAWIDADERHAQAFATMEASWQSFNAPRRAGYGETILREIDVSLAKRSRQRKLYLVGSGLAAAAAVAIAFVSLWPSKIDPTNIPSVAVRPDRQTLPDGSIVELNAGAEIAVNFTLEKRGVRLLKGEALFTVAKDAAHPFIVTAGKVDVRAVGTAFTVHYEPTQVDVLVTEGRVAVERAPTVTLTDSAPESKAEPIYLGAGGRVVVPNDLPVATAVAVQPVSTAAVAEALSWRDKRLEFSDTPLPVAIQLFNQENRLQLSLGDSSLKKRSITGIFWADDPDTFARLLETGFKLKAERSGDEIVLRDASTR